MNDIKTADAFAVPNYLETDPAVTAARKAYLRTVWHAVAPEIELQYGIYNSTVAAPAALFSQAVIESIDRWRQHTQIAQLIEDVANDKINYDYLELFLENYRIKRKVGQRSVGLVRLVFNVDSSYSFAPNDKFTARGLTFRSTANYVISPTGRHAYAVNDSVLQRLDDNTFTATIELESEVISPDANLTAGTGLVMVDRVYPSLIEATVIDSFVGGVAEDKLTDLLPRLINGLTSTVMSSRAHIGAQLRSLELADIKDISIIGAGDIESVRDKHGLFGISQGGRGDIYVRTTDALRTARIVKECRRVPGTDQFRCHLSTTDAPAAYSIISIRRRDGSQDLPIDSETRSIDLGISRYAPDVINYQEGAFSAYQTILLTFIDEDAGSEDVLEYYVSYDYQPGIGELQSYCCDERNVSVLGDLLVKAAIPCKTAISFSVVIQEGQAMPNLVSLAGVAASTINATGFMNVLPGALVIEAVQRLLPFGMFVSDFIMTGDLLLPETVSGAGQVTRLRQTAAAAKEELYFKVLPYVTENTVCFFADPNDVHIAVKSYRSMSRLSG